MCAWPVLNDSDQLKRMDDDTLACVSGIVVHSPELVLNAQSASSHY